MKAKNNQYPAISKLHHQYFAGVSKQIKVIKIKADKNTKALGKQRIIVQNTLSGVYHWLSEVNMPTLPLISLKRRLILGLR